MKNTRFYKVLFVDDDRRYAETLITKAEFHQLELDHYTNWEEAKTKLKIDFDAYVAVILDGKGKLNKDDVGDNNKHVYKAISDLMEYRGQGYFIPYFVLSAYHEIRNTLDYKTYDKTIQDENAMFDAIHKSMEENPNYKTMAKYPEPFECFGGRYLATTYEKLLINIINVSENEQFKDPENLLFNPIRILLERVFERITEVDEKVLPYALINFEKQRPALINCSKYLNGQSVSIGKQNYQPQNKILDAHISQHIQTIIAVCHPASHDVQKRYSPYTFRATLWALFDVLIWLKEFIDSRIVSTK